MLNASTIPRCGQYKTVSLKAFFIKCLQEEVFVKLFLRIVCIPFFRDYNFYYCNQKRKGRYERISGRRYFRWMIRRTSTGIRRRTFRYVEESRCEVQRDQARKNRGPDACVGDKKKAGTQARLLYRQHYLQHTKSQAAHSTAPA